MKLIAHRGDHTKHPENTLPAFQAALDANVYGVEFDVRLTADNVPVVFHYFTLMGTTGTGIFADYDYDHIKTLRVLSEDGQPGDQNDYRMPPLGEVLELFGGEMYLEIHIHPAAPEVIAVVGTMLNNHRSIWDSVEVTSYEPAILLGLQEFCRGITTDLLVPRSEDWMTPEIAARIAVEKARLARARAVHLHVSQLSPRTADYVRGNGLEIHCWDVNSLDTWNTIAALGIEQFTTDNIHRFPKPWR
jgi:glycerophosphoryl diester phosphodiesterase